MRLPSYSGRARGVTLVGVIDIGVGYIRIFFLFASRIRCSLPSLYRRRSIGVSRRCVIVVVNAAIAVGLINRSKYDKGGGNHVGCDVNDILS